MLFYPSVVADLLHLQDTGGFFIAVLEKVAPTPPLEDPKMGHRCVSCMSPCTAAGQVYLGCATAGRT